MGPDEYLGGPVAYEFLVSAVKRGAKLKIWWNDEGQMTKWRSREIVEAVQWFPGKEIEGVSLVETKDGRAFIDHRNSNETSFGSWGGRWSLVSPGDYVWRTKHGHISVTSQKELEEEFENIGG